MDNLEFKKHDAKDTFFVLKVVIDALEEKLNGEDPELIIKLINPLVADVRRKYKAVNKLKRARQHEGLVIIESINPNE